MCLTEEQTRAAHAPGSVAVTAGAGTGKTHMLTERYLHFLKQGISPLQIVAVTFTEKAANELKSRIRQAVNQQIDEGGVGTEGIDDRTLAHLEAAQISTFHALAARICREHPESANVAPDFVVQDELASRLWQAEHLMAALDQLPPGLYEQVPFTPLRESLSALLTDPLTAGQALQRERADWLPALTAFRQQLLERIPTATEWQSAYAELSLHAGPGDDKREMVRQQALSLASDFETTSDIAYLEALSSISFKGGSKKKWADPDSFNAVKEYAETLKKIAKKWFPVIQSLAANEYDDKTEAMLPALRDAFLRVQGFFQDAKRQQRQLDFGDLEVHALKALRNLDVQRYYAQRWTVFLIDEFQDTNPIQGQLLETLTANATLTIVGDPKQSIYGFRRADASVFTQWQARLHSSGNSLVELSCSFRTHEALMGQMNQVFGPVLGELHQSLDAHRQEALKPTPQIALHTVVVEQEQKADATLNTSIESCRLVEAQRIADLVQEMIGNPSMQVHDKSAGELRQIEPKDIAILARTWAPLEQYANAISGLSIPVLQGGGGNLLDTREAKDAWALLRFLADPGDSLALVSVLRSPFFAISDSDLHDFVQSLPEKTAWWTHLKNEPTPELSGTVDVLKALLVKRRTEAPTRLLQLGDRLSGYTAVIANLPGGSRRMADWNGFIELVRSLEQGSFDMLSVLRRLKQVVEAEVSLPRPAVEGGNAVSLMTIHSAKGLEWPVVFVPDLSRSGSPDVSNIRFDAGLGVALKLPNTEGNRQKSGLYALLDERKKLAEKEESKRLLYVAFTRACDRLILTSASPTGGGLDLLSPGISGVVVPSVIPFSPGQALPVEPLSPSLPALPTRVMTRPTNAGLSELPVTALSDYALCPLRFKFRYVDGHPGYRQNIGTGHNARELGQLTHKALELKITDVKRLAEEAPLLPLVTVQEALSLAQRFYTDETYAPYRNEQQREVSISTTVRGLKLEGIIDVVGQDFVLDFKTDQHMQPKHHRFQLWAYSQAAGKAEAHVAYLRHNRLHTFDTEALASIKVEAEGLVDRLMEGDFEAQASEESCGICPFAEVCDRRSF